MNSKITTLKNGFEIISLSKINSNLISLGILINEIPKHFNNKTNKNNNETGIAHFLEHMCFKGTKKYPYQNFINIIEKNNLNINAYTSKEHALFSINCINNIKNIYKSIDLLKEIIFYPKIDEKEIENEKINIKAELMQFYERSIIEGNLKDLIMELGHKIIYAPNTYLNRNVLGDFNIINTMDRNKLIKYHKKYFIPSNMKLIITGIEPNINKNIHNYIINQYKDTFNKYSLILNNNINEDLNYKIKEKYGQEKHYLFKHGHHSGVGIFFQASSYTNIKKYFIYLILEKLLGKYNGIGRGINLTETIDDINIINKDIFYLPYKNNGLFGLILISNNRNLNKKIVEKYLYNLINNVNKREIQKAKNKIIWDLLGIESVSSLMNLSAIQYHYYNKILNNKKIIDLINRITIEEIYKSIQQLIHDYENKKYNYIFIDNIFKKENNRF